MSNIVNQPLTEREARSRRNFRKYAADLVRIFIGTTVTSVAVKYLLDPAGLVTGGVSGLAIVVRYVTADTYAIPLWLTNLVLNVPIFVLAFAVDGWKRTMRTAMSWLLMTFELAVFPEHPLVSDNLFLVSIYGGILFGIGAGVLLSAKASTGGTDMLANTITHFFRYISVGTWIWVFDGIVVALGAVVFGVTNTLYAILSVFICGFVTDYIIDSGKKAKMVLIISAKPAELKEEILLDMDRGCTILHGEGGYTGQERKVLLCICTNKDVVSIKDLVKEIDPGAVFVVGNVSEALGEGFIERWG